jgi:hypothetical protein
MRVGLLKRCSNPSTRGTAAADGRLGREISENAGQNARTAPPDATSRPPASASSGIRAPRHPCRRRRPQRPALPTQYCSRETSAFAGIASVTAASHWSQSECADLGGRSGRNDHFCQCWPRRLRWPGVAPTNRSRSAHPRPSASSAARIATTSRTWRRSRQADRATELHFFPGAAEAQDAAHVVEPVVGSPDESVLDGVPALGPVLVVHYSFFIADRPGGVGIEEGLEPVEALLRETGHVQS